MRVLVGVDGSRSAEQACDLVGSLDWPAGSTARLVAAYDAIGAMVAWPGVTLLPETVDLIQVAARNDATEIVETAARRLERPGLSIETAVEEGRPADVILEAAISSAPDLIVLGHRGLGPFESALLGSVSAEVVDRATYPVLVARTREISRILVADDGSPDAQAAADLVRRLPVLHHRPVFVLSVAETDPRWPRWLRPLEPRHADEAAHAADANREAHAAQARQTADRLRGAGLAADSAALEGPAARCIVETAVNHATDLIVIGMRGRTGITRFLPGSVARNVLWHAPCSVLIAPPQ